MKEEDIRKREVLNRYLELVQEDCQTFFVNREDLKEVACPACGLNTYRQEFQKSQFEYVTCRACETLYARTRPSLEKLKQFYDGSPSTKYWINDFFKPVAGVRREKIFKPRAEAIVERFGKDPSWFIGDIGAGFGLFLGELRKLWPSSEYVAIEPSSEQAELSKNSNFRVECCLLEELKGYENRFDLLTALELLEHLYDPSLFLKHVYRLLKPGGWLFITTLNGQGFDIQVLWEHSKSIYPPCHINFFNPDSLSNLLGSIGFMVEELKTPGKLDWDIVEGMVKNEGINLGRFWKLFSEKGSIEAKQGFQDWLSCHLFSSHMRVLAKKQT